jgi:hypothetical protein
MLVTINVTREDIREADMTDYTQCMVGRAFRRVIDKSFEEVGVIYDYAHVDEKSFSVPTYVSELIWRQTTRTRRFKFLPKSWFNVQPFTFEMDIPAEYLNIEVPRFDLEPVLV